MLSRIMRYITSIQEDGAASIPDGTIIESHESMVALVLLAAQEYDADITHCWIDSGIFTSGGTTVFYSQLLESA